MPPTRYVSTPSPVTFGVSRSELSSHELLLQQEEVFDVTSSFGVVEVEEQHEDTFFDLDSQQELEESFSVFVVSVLLLQHEVFLGTIGISFLEEQHDDVSFTTSILAGIDGESLHEEV
nr:hypothetical protein [Bacillus sp. AFS018417]